MNLCAKKKKNNNKIKERVCRGKPNQIKIHTAHVLR